MTRWAFEPARFWQVSGEDVVSETAHAGRPAGEAAAAGRRAQPILGAAVATSIALAILVALGVWQMHRLRWKEGLLAQIDAAEHLPPTPLAGGTPPLFTRVIAKGTLVAPPFALYGVDVQGDQLGADLVETLVRPGLKPVLVVLGWVPTQSGAPRPVTGPAEVTGYVRLPETPNWLSAPDDPDGRRFYTLDPRKIGGSLGVEVAPFTLVALGAPPRVPGVPIPADALPRPVNNHLQYALTWFGLAAALLGVFVAWAKKGLLF